MSILIAYLCVCYDPWDNYVFDYVVFTDKASAKSYRHHFKSPDMIVVQVLEVPNVNVPKNVIIRKEENPFWFKRCELAEHAANTECMRKGAP